MPHQTIPPDIVSPLTKDQQINELNSEVKCKIAQSKVHGVGVFALYDIKKGQRMYCAPRLVPIFYTIPYGSLSKLFPEIRELVIDRWPSVINGSAFPSPNDDAKLLLFMNHNNEPNYDLTNDTALRDIKAGEEIFENYCTMQNATKVYKWLKCD